MRVSVSHFSDVHYLKVMLAPVISNPQNYSLSQHLTSMRVAPIVLTIPQNYVPSGLHGWSLPLSPFRWVSLPHLVRKLPKLDIKNH